MECVDDLLSFNLRQLHRGRAVLLCRARRFRFLPLHARALND